jgi:Holliday junction resolvasome RuvABC endonuclease subunit
VSVAGIDFSSHAVDVVLLDEDSDRATWHRVPLVGPSAFDRARMVRLLMLSQLGSAFWDDVLAVGIEQPRGNHGVVHMARIQGAVLSCIPTDKLVHPLNPSEWRKAVGLSGNATKERVQLHVAQARPTGWVHTPWPFDACDAYCIALATRLLIETKTAA